MKDELGYFTHDANASHDPNILKMCSVYKSEGYGWYWMLVEMMRQQDGYKLDLSGAYTWNAYALHLYTDASALQKFVDDCVEEFHLFMREDNWLWSASLLRRMEAKDAIREEKRKAAQIRWGTKETSVCNADAMQMQSKCNAKVSKVSKSSQVKEEKKDTRPTVVVPEWLSMDSWNDFLDMRKKLKKPATDRAQELIIQKLEAFRSQGHDVKAILNQSVTSSWTDVYEVKTVRNNGNHAAAVEEKTEDRRPGIRRGE